MQNSDCTVNLKFSAKLTVVIRATYVHFFQFSSPQLYSLAYAYGTLAKFQAEEK